jgi:tetratricopeptide (TPR) repeat protein
MLQRFGPTEDRQIPDRLAAACLLAPEAVAQYDELVRALEKAAADTPNVCTHYHTLGPMLYRAGRFAEAVQQLKQAIQFHGQDGLVPDRLFLAMALHRLGQADEARQWLDKAVEQIDREEKDKSSEAAAATPLAWPVRLENQLLRREAEALIEGKVPEPKK